MSIESDLRKDGIKIVDILNIGASKEWAYWNLINCLLTRW